MTQHSEGIALDEVVRQLLEESEATASSYIFARAMTDLMESLREERVRQGLTQSDIAHRLNTTQSSIARLENDRTGSVTLRRLWDYAGTLGVAPLTTLKPLGKIIERLTKAPLAPLNPPMLDVSDLVAHFGARVKEQQKMTSVNTLANSMRAKPGPATSSNISVPFSFEKLQTSGSISNPSYMNSIPSYLEGKQELVSGHDYRSLPASDQRMAA